MTSLFIVLVVVGALLVWVGNRRADGMARLVGWYALLLGVAGLAYTYAA